jgi:hypothetical protein
MQLDQTTASVIGRDTTEIDATGADIGTPPFIRTEAWTAEFEKQLTPKLMDRIRKYARSRLYPAAVAGCKIDKYAVRELAQSVATDTWLGELRWDPVRCPLEAHLVVAVRSRAYSVRRHAEDFPGDTLGEGTEASEDAEREASAAIADPMHAIEHVYARQTLALIRAEATNDAPVLQLLDAYEAGATKKEDVLALMKMKARTYHNAQIRLKRIVRKLIDQKLDGNDRA